MESNQSKEAEKIIQNHSFLAALPGFWPIPLADIAAVTAIQLDMVKQLCKVYEKDYSDQRGKSIVLALTSTVAGRIPGYAIRASVRSIPLVGWAIGGLSLAYFARLSTYATGMVFKAHFEEGGTLNDLNPASFRKFYNEQMEKARKMKESFKWPGTEDEAPQEDANDKEE